VTRRPRPARLLLALLVAAACAALAPAAGAAPVVKVRLTACTPALSDPARLLTVEAIAPLAGGAARMELRFTLQARPLHGSGSWTALKADGFDAWLAAGPGVRRVVYDKTVHSLVADARYRVVVRVRWLGADGARVGRTVRATSPVCAQPDLRPDLHPAALAVRPAPEPGLARYSFTVRNLGGAGVDGFEYAVDVGGAPGAIRRGPGLGAGKRRVIVLLAPACAPGDAVAVRLDPLGRLDEADETDDVLTATCPGGAGG
jgi:hypothetical protein